MELINLGKVCQGILENALVNQIRVFFNFQYLLIVDIFDFKYLDINK